MPARGWPSRDGALVGVLVRRGPVQALGRYSNSTEATQRLNRLAARARSERIDSAPRAVPSRKIGKKLSPALQQAVVEAYVSGMRFTDVALQFDLDESTVSKYLKLAGVERHSLSMSKAVVAEAKRLRDRGVTTKRIAVRLGYAWHTVNNALQS